MTDPHITTPAPHEEDLVADQTLRPTNFDEFVGQSDVVENLKLYIEASQKRGEALDHVYFSVHRDWVRQPWPTLFQKNWM